MGKKKFGFVLLGLALAFGILISGCDNGSTGVEDGDLSGSIWQRTIKSSTYDFTDTYTFTSTGAGNLNHKGWGMVGSKKNNYNDTTNFTYIYDGAVNRLGVITTSGGSKSPFSISSDYQTLTVGSTKYTRK
ncbi:MAG: hypothetical protein LBP81_09025 [Treponema sp.]|nr:hypothetical protein [Treponema sp.]